jgi:uncharacterized protein
MEVPDGELREILEHARTIAVVGLSDNEDRDSHRIARYLQANGYRVVPVNPLVRQVLGETSYPTLTSVPPEIAIDIVDIFRRSDKVGPTVDEAITRHVPVLWMQLGVANAQAAERARGQGIVTLENMCIMVQHRRLGIRPLAAGS